MSKLILMRIMKQLLLNGNQNIHVAFKISQLSRNIPKTSLGTQTVDLKIPGGGGGWGTLIFFLIRRLGPSISRSPQKISGISSTPQKSLKF